MNLDRWLSIVNECLDPDTIKILIANKVDKDPNFNQVPKEEAMKFAYENNMHFFECSAKSGHNIELAFCRIVEEVSCRTDMSSFLQPKSITLKKKKTKKRKRCFLGRLFRKK